MCTIPLVSVIIPSYNYGFVIADTLDSLQRQTLSNWEAIVVDDGSIDDTESVVQAYVKQDSRVLYIKQANAGLPAARNAGMKVAKGKYIQFLDADDLLGCRKLELHAGYLDVNHNESIVFGDVRYFFHGEPINIQYANDKQSELIPYRTLNSEEAVLILFKHNIVVCNSPLFRKELIDEVGFCDEKMTSLEDWDYWFRMVLCGHSFNYLTDSQAMALVRVHKKSMSWNWDRMTANRSVLQKNVSNYILKFIKDKAKREELLTINKNASMHYLAFSVFINIKQGDFWWGIKHGIIWAHEYKSYLYFFKNIVHSIKIRIKSNS